MIKRCLAVLLSVAFLAPSAAFAQAPKAGVITTLEGNVTARRVALPDAVPLKFKDDVFLQDTVATGDKSLARMLLGGKAVVTVRERSVLTITEVPGKSTIDLESGKFALAVAREKMRPGEEIQIRTPNAVAGVRGTVVVTEVSRPAAPAGQPQAAAPAVLTNFYVLRGTIVAQQFDPGTRQPVGAPLNIGTLQSYSGSGTSTPRVAPVPPEAVAGITSGLSASSSSKGGKDAGQEQVKGQAVQTAVQLVTALMGSGGTVTLAVTPTTTGTLSSTLTTTQSQTSAPVIVGSTSTTSTSTFTTSSSDLITQLNTFIQTLLALLGNVTFTDSSVKSFSSSFSSTSTSPLITGTSAFIVQTGSGADIVQVSSGGDVSLAGPVATLTNSTVVSSGSLLNISGGKLKSTTTSPLVSLDPTTVSASNALIRLTSGGSLTVAGPLLKDTNGTISFSGDFLGMTNATLTGTGTDALIQLSGTSLSGSDALSATGSTISLAGPLATITSVSGSGFSNSTNALFKLDGSTLTDTTTSPLLTFTSTSPKPGGNFFRLVNGSRLSLAGPLLSESGGSIGSGLSTSVASFFTVLDASSITDTSSSALISLSSTSESSQGGFFSVRRSPSASNPTKVTLAGPLLSASSTSFTTTSTGLQSTFGNGAGNCCSLFSVSQGAQFTSTSTSPLISFTSVTSTQANSSVASNFVNVSDTFNGAAASDLVSPATLTLSGPLLSASGSTINTSSVLGVFRSTVSGSSTSSFLSLSNSTVNASGTDIITGGPTFGRLVAVLSSSSSGTTGSAASLSVGGPLASLAGSTFNGNQMLGIFNGASVTSSSGTLFSLDSSPVNLSTVVNSTNGTSRADFLSIGGFGSTSGSSFATLNLNGPFLSVTNGGSGTLTMGGRLVNVFAGGQIIVTDSGSSSPFVSITGGTHSIGTDSGHALFNLVGRTTVTSSDSFTGGAGTTTVTFGTDQPLQRSGSGAYFQLNGATVNTKSGVIMDDALLTASAPLLELKSSSTLTSAGNGIDLTGKAKITGVGPVFKIDGSTMTITSGSAININGSILNITSGDLFQLSNGGKLTVNGAAITVQNGGVLNVSGSLVNFASGSGSQINVNNTLCLSSCFSSGGVNYNCSSCSSNNVSITNPIKNSGNGSIVLSNSITTAVINVIGSSSKVTISGN